jgi:AcrR family transcriptional regulator
MPSETRPTTPRRRKPGRPPASDGAVTRQTLVEVAGRHFARSGYGGAALKDIARDANMTSGAIYYYFESKSELYAAVGEHWVVHVTRHYAERLTPGMALADRLKLYLEVVVDQVVEEPDFAWFWMHVDVEGDRHAPVAELRAKMWPRSVVLRAGVANGSLGADGADPVAQIDHGVPVPGSEDLPAVLLIEAFVLGIGRVAVQPDGPQRLPLLVEALKQMIDGHIDALEPPHRLAA